MHTFNSNLTSSCFSNGPTCYFILHAYPAILFALLSMSHFSWNTVFHSQSHSKHHCVRMKSTLLNQICGPISLVEWHMYPAVYSLFFIVSVPANYLSLYVAWRLMLKGNSMVVYLVSLSISDLLSHPAYLDWTGTAQAFGWWSLQHFVFDLVQQLLRWLRYPLLQLCWSLPGCGLPSTLSVGQRGEHNSCWALLFGFWRYSSMFCYSTTWERWNLSHMCYQQMPHKDANVAIIRVPEFPLSCHHHDFLLSADHAVSQAEHLHLGRRAQESRTFIVVPLFSLHCVLCALQDCYVPQSCDGARDLQLGCQAQRSISCHSCHHNSELHTGY